MAIYKNTALVPHVHSLEQLISNKIRYSTRIFFFFLRRISAGNEKAISQVPFASVLNESSCNTDFDLHEKEPYPGGRTLFMDEWFCM